MTTLSIGGDRHTILLDGSQTNNAYTIIETLTPPDAGPPPHLHQREDEHFLLLLGEVTLFIGGEAMVLKPGDYAVGPRGIPHYFRNTGTTDSVLLITLMPAGIERFFQAAGTPLHGRDDRPIPFAPADAPGMNSIASEFGMEILAAD